MILAAHGITEALVLLFLLIVSGLLVGVRALVKGIRGLLARRITLFAEEATTGVAAVVGSAFFIVAAVALIALVVAAWLDLCGYWNGRWELDFPFPRR
jgi:hypothetical protein